jgi:hypothetical protein
LVVAGEDATLVARFTTERLATLLPNARLESIRFGSRPNDPFGGDTATTLADLIESAILSN